MIKVLDFAGGTVVHINSGIAGLMCALMLGKRKDTGARPQHGADLHRRLAAVGRLVRLQRRLGGDGRHAGRHGDGRHAVRDRDRRLHLDAGRVDPCAASRPSSASAPARWPASSPSRRPRASSARSARSRSASPPASSATGASPGSSTCSATTTRSMRSACMRVGGIVGALLTGVFAVEQYGGTAGLIEGNAAQVLNQIVRHRHRVRLRRRRVARSSSRSSTGHRPARHRGGRARRPRSRAARRDRTIEDGAPEIRQRLLCREAPSPAGASCVIRSP